MVAATRLALSSYSVIQWSASIQDTMGAGWGGEEGCASIQDTMGAGWGCGGEVVHPFRILWVGGWVGGGVGAFWLLWVRGVGGEQAGTRHSATLPSACVLQPTHPRACLLLPSPAPQK